MSANPQDTPSRVLLGFLVAGVATCYSGTTIEPTPSCTPGALYCACPTAGKICEGETQCLDGLCVPKEEVVCGDGIVDSSEMCDDGNPDNDDGCDADCVPTSAIGLGTGWRHSCAILRSGAVRCWGGNAQGELGYGHTDNIGDDEQPFQAGNVELGSKAMQLALGRDHTCALLDTGKVICWGNNEFGQLGYGNTSNVGDGELPSEAGTVELGSEATALGAGLNRNCGILTNGWARCWGVERDGGVDDGLVGNNEVPLEYGAYAPLEGRYVDVAISLDGPILFHCTLSDIGKVRCWGDNAEGSLGYGIPSSYEPYDHVYGEVILAGPARKLSLGDNHSCALFQTGSIQCWGDNSSGQIGYPDVVSIGEDSVPADYGTIEIGIKAVELDAGGKHTCAVVADGGLFCWGDNSSRQLGVEGTQNVGDDEDPKQGARVTLSEKVVLVSAGGSHTCAILDSGNVKCWGANHSGQLGYGVPGAINFTPEDLPPVPIWTAGTIDLPPDPSDTTNTSADESGGLSTGGEGTTSSSTTDHESEGGSSDSGPTDDDTSECLLLAEVSYRREGDDAGYQWIKLFNACEHAIELDGLNIGWGTSSYLVGTLSLSGSIASMSCLLLGGPNSDASNANPQFDQTSQFQPQIPEPQSGASSGVGIFIGEIQEGSVPVDAVIFGDVNASLLDPAGNTPVPYINNVQPGWSIRRTSTSATWQALVGPTPNVCLHL